jgi:regulator of replication initiation timing
MIFLLALASIFLCGTVVTYVSSATNYKEALDTANAAIEKLRIEKAKAEADRVDVRTTLDEYRKTTTLELEKLNANAVELNKTNTTLVSENNRLKKELNDERASVTTLTNTNAQQVKLIDSQREELLKANQTLTTLEARMTEANNALISKMGIIDGLDTEKKQLAEQMVDLQKQLNQLLSPQGRQVVRPAPVTPSVGPVQPAPPAAPIGREIGLKGTITEVDAKNGVASISIGTATGVLQNQRFFVTRGNSFICEMQIIAVQPDMAVGALQRVSQKNPPKPGDSVQTNL